MPTPGAPVLLLAATLGAILVDAAPDGSGDSSLSSACTADVTGEAVMEARCRATCLQKFATPSGGTQAHCGADCVMCWDHCGMLKEGPASRASVCRDPYLCYAGCRVACDFLGLGRGRASSSSSSVRTLRIAADSTAPLRLRALPPPQLDADGLRLHWQAPTPAATASTTVPSSSPTPAAGQRQTLDQIVYIVSSKRTSSMAWKVLAQTADPWLTLRPSLRRVLVAVSVLAVSPDGPLARASLCLPPRHRHEHEDEEEEEDEEDDADDDPEEVEEESAPNAESETAGNIIHMLAARSFGQLRGKHVGIKEEDDAEDGSDEDDDEEWSRGVDEERLNLVHRILGSSGFSTSPSGSTGVSGEAAGGSGFGSGWRLRLLGIWSGAGGARLPRARVAWTPPRRATEVLVRWAVPALGISGSRVVSGVAQAEVPLVEEHATRVTVGDAHEVSAALVLRLSVQTDASGEASTADLLSGANPRKQQEQQQQQQQGQQQQRESELQRAHQAALWEATLVAVGLVVGAAALCVALLVVAYGVHSRIARFCSASRVRAHGGGGHGVGIHSKSSSVVPLNDPNA